jgi:hypothetical protein
MKTLISTIRRALADAAARSLAALLPRRLMSAKRHFSLWERHGYHVTPVHYYEPVPDVKSLPERLWHDPDELAGIRMNDDSQLALLELLSSRYQLEYAGFPRESCADPTAFHVHNGWFTAGDVELLYGLIRHLQPKTIIEVGSGYSTQVTSMAIEANKAELLDYDCRLISIEPFPRHELLDKCLHPSERIEMPVQEVPLYLFQELSPNDILFIDSSHVAKCGSDVNHEFFRIIPSLAPGVLVHLHDIFLPFEYPHSWIKDRRLFWNEQYLLRAFLTFNNHFEVVWAANYVNQIHPQRLKAAFSSLRPDDQPSSFWMRCIGRAAAARLSFPSNTETPANRGQRLA